MALTATATIKDREDISQTLGLRHPYILALCPTKPNIRYSVARFKSVSETFHHFAERLTNEKDLFPKTGITFKMCADIYLYLKDFLGFDSTVPYDAPDIPEFRIIDMFTSVVTSDHKSSIIELFKENTKLRVVVATTAFRVDEQAEIICFCLYIATSTNLSYSRHRHQGICFPSVEENVFLEIWPPSTLSLNVSAVTYALNHGCGMCDLRLAPFVMFN